MLLDKDLTLIAASKSFCRVFQIDSAGVPGRAFRALGSGEWNVPQLASLLRATAAGYAEVEGYEIDLNRENRESRRLVLNAQKLDYGDADSVRLLVSVSDVTDARIAEKLKDDLLAEKAVLLQELQHRVANSAQSSVDTILLPFQTLARDLPIPGAAKERTARCACIGACPILPCRRCADKTQTKIWRRQPCLSSRARHSFG